MRRVSFSLGDDLYKAVERVRRVEGVKRSQIIARALREHLSKHERLLMREDKRRYPTVLWKLRLAGGMTLRSPRLTDRRIGEKWIVEEY